jgi:CheY-like chemotaxis protein
MSADLTKLVRGRVVVVDDDDDVRALILSSLERRGLEVVALSSGAEALAYLAHDTPALMLLDLNMDDMSGWEVIGSLDREPRLRAMKTIIVTGEAASSVPRRFRYLRKPFRLEALVDLLNADADAVVA